MPSYGGNPRPPAPKPAPVVSAHGNVGASQPRGTAKLTPRPAPSYSGVAARVQHQQAAQAPAHRLTPSKPRISATAKLNPGRLTKTSARVRMNEAKIEQLLARDRSFRVSVPHISGTASIGNAAEHHGGDLLGTAASIALAPVLGPAGALLAHEAPKLLANTGKDLVNIAPDTVKGGLALGKAWVDDIGNRITGIGAHPSEVGHMLSNAATQGVIGHLARGDVPGAWKTFEQHPVYGASELAGGYGLVGRGAGAAARSGLIGERAAAAASTARAGRELAPGLAPDVQHYSKNYLTKKAQQFIERHPEAQRAVDTMSLGPVRRYAGHQIDRSPTLGKTAAKTRVGQLLQKRVDEQVAASKARETVAVQDVVKGLHEHMPKAKGRATAAADTVPRVAMGQIRNQHYIEDAHTVLEQLREAEQAHLAAEKLGLHERMMRPAVLEANRAHQASLEAALKHPDVEAALRSAAHAVATGTRQDAQKTDLGLLVPQEAERRALGVYAHEHIPGVQRVNRNAIPSPRAYDARTAYRELQDYRRAVEDAQREVLKLKYRKAPPEHLQAARDALTAAKDTYKDARHEYTQNHKPFLKEKQGGLVIHDPAAPLIRAGTYKGQQLRPLLTDEIKQHMATAGQDPVTYVRLTAPRDQEGYGLKARGTRGGSQGKSATYSGLKAGAFETGYKHLAKSQVANEYAIQRALSHDLHITENGLQKPGGGYFTTTDWQPYAEEYKRVHGITLVPMYAHPQRLTEAKMQQIHAVQDPNEAAQLTQHAAFEARRVSAHADEPVRVKVNGRWRTQDAHPEGNVVLEPKPSLDRYMRHIEVDGQHGVMAWLNQKFRNTVLPLSPKWLVGNATEAAGRGLLVGAPRNGLLAGKVLNRMRELGHNAEADHLERMALGGLHYGMQHRLNAEQIGLSDTSSHAALAVAQKLGRAYTSGLVQRVFNFNRRFESGAEKMVLGRHMQRQLQEMSGTWLKAVTHQRDYIDALAKGYASPQMAADAGRYIHETLGQYDRFSPTMKRFVRSVAPFAPWYINAAKFVYYTLPMKHPITQATLLDVARANNEDWARRHNVPHGQFGPIQIGDLESALKTGPTDFLNLGRYVPEGAFTSGPVDFMQNMFLPQLSGAIHAVNGQDPFGNELTNPHGKATDTMERLSVALNDLLMGFAGPSNVLHRVIADSGSTPYSASTLWHTMEKPFTHHGPSGILGGLNRVFNPFEPTHLGKSYPHGTATPGRSPLKQGQAAPGYS